MYAVKNDYGFTNASDSHLTLLDHIELPRLHKLDCNENWLIKYLAKFNQ